jgi:hypothetical protein
VKRGKYQITGNTAIMLSQLLFVKAFFDTNEKYQWILKHAGRLTIFKHKKRFDIDMVLGGKMPEFTQRAIVKQYLEAGFKLKHTKVIETTALLWYQCRVVHDGPTGYYHEQLRHTSSEDPVVLEPENLLHELKDFDEALGYIREKTGKRKTK